jgi:homoserine O-acetyltransferase
LYLTRAMDLYDVARDGGESLWLDKVAAPMLLVGIRSDWLFPPDAICEFTTRMVGAGKDARYAELDSPHGHDAFLKEWEQLSAVISPFLAEFSGGS